MMKRKRRTKSLTPVGAIRLAPEIIPDIVALIKEEFPGATSRLKTVLLLRAYGFQVSEIATHFKTYRNDIYRVLWRAQKELELSQDKKGLSHEVIRLANEALDRDRLKAAGVKEG